MFDETWIYISGVSFDVYCPVATSTFNKDALFTFVSPSRDDYGLSWEKLAGSLVMGCSILYADIIAYANIRIASAMLSTTWEQ